jgi:hypothetical protein
VNGSQIIGFKQLMEQRTAYLLDHVVYNFPAPELSEVGYELAGNTVVFAAKSPEARTVWIYHRSATFYPWQRTALRQTEDGNWNLELPLDQAREYYLVAEGEKAARVYPERASKEFLTVEIEK